MTALQMTRYAESGWHRHTDFVTHKNSVAIAPGSDQPKGVNETLPSGTIHKRKTRASGEARVKPSKLARSV